MIIAELILFISICLFTTLSLSGLGQILTNKANKNFLDSFFYGFIVLSFIITFVHFFIKINFYLSFFVILLGFILSLKNFNISIKNIKKEHVIYLLIFLILIPIYISQKYHEDFGYYHLPYIINLINEKIIFGLGNVNRGFVHNSIWLNILPFFNFKDNYNFVGCLLAIKAFSVLNSCNFKGNAHGYY